MWFDKKQESIHVWQRFDNERTSFDSRWIVPYWRICALSLTTQTFHEIPGTWCVILEGSTRRENMFQNVESRRTWLTSSRSSSSSRNCPAALDNIPLKKLSVRSSFLNNRFSTSVQRCFFLAMLEAHRYGALRTTSILAIALFHR